MKRTLVNRQENDFPESFGRLPKIQKRASVDPALILSYNRGSASTLQWSAFEHIVVLGDSYSSDADNNWLGFLQKRLPSNSRPTVHNFAKGGDTVEDDLALQVERLFTRLPTADSLERNAEILVVIWLGINDCGRTDADELEPIVEQIFEAMHELYIKWKARSFLLIDVPPMHRSPGGKSMDIDDERYTTWNDELLRQAKDFTTDASKASIFVVSSYAIISDILDEPATYGLSDCIDEKDSTSENDDEDEESEGIDEDDSEKAMWVDDIHLSTAGHRALANRLWNILGG